MSKLRRRTVQALDTVARARARAGSPHAQADLDKKRLEARLAAIEADVKECRRLHRRLAELTDVVEELLVPLASRDQARVDEAVARYRAGL